MADVDGLRSLGLAASALLVFVLIAALPLATSAAFLVSFTHCAVKSDPRSETGRYFEVWRERELSKLSKPNEQLNR